MIQHQKVKFKFFIILTIVFKKEILEYAKFLGLDPKNDQELMYLAKEGLTAKLPNN